MQTIDELKQNYSLKGKIDFREENDILLLEVNTAHSTAKIALQGAQILSFIPHGEKDLLFQSKNLASRKGGSIRAGAPVCWPWFGPHPEENDLPAHGLARTSVFQLIAAKEKDDEEVEVQFELTDDEHTIALFPHSFRLIATMNIGKALTISLTTEHNGESDFTITEALHTYFAIGDIEQVEIAGLNGAKYHDKVAHVTKEETDDTIRISSETDRVYVNTESSITIRDHSMKREIILERTDCKSTVVWNPWEEKAKGLKMPEGEFRAMLCVENGNVLENAVTLKPGESHTMTAKIYSHGLS